MRELVSLLFIVSTLACGKIRVEHNVNGKVDGNINHVVSFSLSEIEQAFYKQCLYEHPTYNEQQLQTCTSDKLENFLNFINQGLSNDPDTN